MKFIDEAHIEVIAGHGGDGAASFRRERCIPFGGPNGGDGGDGGHIYLLADANINTLIDFRYTRVHKAQDGERGRGGDCYGKSGEDLVLKVPIGTMVFNTEDDTLLMDLSHDGQKYMLAKGGSGGWGNIRFKSSTNQTPKFAAPGLPGQTFHIRLELKVLADVGLLGMPNAGKSSLIQKVSNARPRVADYPFTTLHPHLGVVRVAKDKSFVMADIPGLIEGAADGAGLGHQFLRHLQRSRILLHVIDPYDWNGDNRVIDDAMAILEELKAYDPDLYAKPRWLVINKLDLLTDPQTAQDLIKDYQAACGHVDKTYVISALNGEGCQKLCLDLYTHLYGDHQAYHVDTLDPRFSA